MIERVRKTLLALFWLAASGLPVAFFLAPAKASLEFVPLSELYTTFVQLLGEPGARVLFCSVWLAAVGLLFWRFVISQRPVSAPVEGLAD